MVCNERTKWILAGFQTSRYMNTSTVPGQLQKLEKKWLDNEVIYD